VNRRRYPNPTLNTIASIEGAIGVRVKIAIDKAA